MHLSLPTVLSKKIVGFEIQTN